MVVQHNLQAMNASRMLGVTTSSQSKATEKLSSGYRINRAADDAAGLTISEKMRKQIRGLDRASTNAQDGISCVQTAEGALTEVHAMLQRMNELAVQAANGTNSKDDRQAIQDEIDQLVTEIDRVSETTKFNEIYLLKGKPGTEVTKTSYSYAIADAAKADQETTLQVKAGQDAYAPGASAAITGEKKAGPASFTVTGTVYGTTGGASNGGTAVAITDANKDDFFEVDDDGNVTLKTGANLWDAAASAAANSEDANIANYVKGTAKVDADVPSEIDEYVEVAEDGSLKYKEGKVLYKVDAEAATEFGDQLEGQKIAEADLSNYFELGGNPLTDSAGAKIEETDISKYFKNGVYQGGIYKKNAAGAKTEIGADQIEKFIKVTEKVSKTAEDLEFKLHVGAESAEDNKIEVKIQSISAGGIGIDVLKENGLMTEDDATEAIKTIGNAISLVSKQRSALGAIQNRLEHTIANLDNVVENTTSAESRIRDTDMADMMVEYSKNNILAQAGQSMLAQANQSTQGVLSLLQ